MSTRDRPHACGRNLTKSMRNFAITVCLLRHKLPSESWSKVPPCLPSLSRRCSWRSLHCKHVPHAVNRVFVAERVSCQNCFLKGCSLSQVSRTQKISGPSPVGVMECTRRRRCHTFSLRRGRSNERVIMNLTSPRGEIR